MQPLSNSDWLWLLLLPLLRDSTPVNGLKKCLAVDSFAKPSPIGDRGAAPFVPNQHIFKQAGPAAPGSCVQKVTGRERD